MPSLLLAAGCSDECLGVESRTRFLLESPEWGVLLLDGQLTLQRLEDTGWMPMAPGPVEVVDPDGAAIDEAEQRLVVVGAGENGACSTSTWVYERSSGWRRLAGEGPTRREHPRMWFDRRDGMLHFGGGDYASYESAIHDEWVLSSDVWVQIVEKRR